MLLQVCSPVSPPAHSQVCTALGVQISAGHCVIDQSQLLPEHVPSSEFVADPVLQLPLEAHQPHESVPVQVSHVESTEQGSETQSPQAPQPFPVLSHCSVPMPPVEQAQVAVLPGVQTQSEHVPQAVPALLQVSVPVPPPVHAHAAVALGVHTIVGQPLQTPQAVPSLLQVSVPVPLPVHAHAAVELGVQVWAVQSSQVPQAVPSLLHV